MLESINISKLATFQGEDQAFNDLKKINYVFGCNGSGKTTISRIIADAESYPSCSLSWQAGMPLQTLVYNRDFVEKNFSSSSDLKGVFTLGEENIDTLDKIDKAKSDLDKLDQKVTNLKLQLQSEDGNTGKNVELSTLEKKFEKKCWEQKKKHDAKLKGALEGYRNSAEKFRNKVLEEAKSNNSELLPLEDLESKAATVFGETPTKGQAVPKVSLNALQAHESNSILNKRVIGKDDVDIATMIKKLGNSDWVRKGRSFYEANDGYCPFCQQETDEAFEQSLNEYFDESFETDSKAIDDLISNYKTDAERLQVQLIDIITAPSRFLDIEKLKAEKELLDSKIIINTQKLAEKKKEPSSIIELESIANVTATIQALINEANAQISKHNALVENIVAERNKLTAQVWKFIVEELKTELTEYKKIREALNEDIESINSAIGQAETDRKTKTQRILALEKEITSIQPTLDGINGLLKSLGFHSFSLQLAEDKISYRLVRNDGSCAKETLSEGEKSFVTFLYFFHLLKGSNARDGITTNRIIVFDDPVSSLDSDILFIVSSLIKRLCEETRSDTGYIKQVFVLTHNVYFHKEVTFDSRRSNKDALKEETFWVVRKCDGISEIQKHPINPISTSYELLWLEVKNASHTNTSIPNTLRRILEHYFKILGGVDFDHICEKFQGYDKVVCKSLFSWVNAGSHGVLDDLHISDIGVSGDVYLRVFQEIFDKSNHTAHYKMMLGVEAEKSANQNISAAATTQNHQSKMGAA